MAAASVDEESALSTSFDATETDPLQVSRVAILELRKGFELETQDTTIEKLGEWCVEGRVEGIGIFPDAEGTHALNRRSTVVFELRA